MPMAAGDVLGLILIVFEFAIAIWAATDSKRRGYPTLKIVFIFFLVLFLSLLGLILYFILRPSGKLAVCQRCNKKVLPTLEQCPHCGLKKQRPAPRRQPVPPPPQPAPQQPKVRKIKCPHCGQMVEHNWKTCPYCSRKIIISKTIIDEVFLIYRDGRLIKHFTRRIKPDVDQDILSGMLTAVQDFIRDSFRGETGDLNHMQFGRFQILMGHGRFITVAAVMMGDEIEPFRPQIIKSIDAMEADYEVLLRDWDGDVEQLNVLGRYIMDLIEGRFS